jgi:hypothetical protein
MEAKVDFFFFLFILKYYLLIIQILNTYLITFWTLQKF